MMKYTGLFSLLLLFLLSCESDTPNNFPNGKMVVNKDGVSFTITEFNNYMIDDVRFGNEAVQLVLSAEVDGGTLNMAIGNWLLQEPPTDGILEKSYDLENQDIIANRNAECVDGPTGPLCDDALVTYSFGGTDIYNTGVEDDSSDGIITIASNDPANKTVSGSFDFVTQAFGGDSTIAFTGTFENLVYTRQ